MQFVLSTTPHSMRAPAKWLGSMLVCTDFSSSEDYLYRYEMEGSVGLQAPRAESRDGWGTRNPANHPSLRRSALRHVNLPSQVLMILGNGATGWARQLGGGLTAWAEAQTPHAVHNTCTPYKSRAGSWSRAPKLVETCVLSKSYPTPGLLCYFHCMRPRHGNRSGRSTQVSMHGARMYGVRGGMSMYLAVCMYIHTSLYFLPPLRPSTPSAPHTTLAASYILPWRRGKGPRGRSGFEKGESCAYARVPTLKHPHAPIMAKDHRSKAIEADSTPVFVLTDKAFMHEIKAG